MVRTTVEGLTTKEAAFRANVTPTYIRQLMGRGRLDFTQTPYGRLVDPESLERFIREREERVV